MIFFTIPHNLAPAKKMRLIDVSGKHISLKGVGILDENDKKSSLKSHGSSQNHSTQNRDINGKWTLRFTKSSNKKKVYILAGLYNYLTQFNNKHS